MLFIIKALNSSKIIKNKKVRDYLVFYIQKQTQTYIFSKAQKKGIKY